MMDQYTVNRIGDVTIERLASVQEKSSEINDSSIPGPPLNVENPSSHVSVASSISQLSALPTGSSTVKPPKNSVDSRTESQEDDDCISDDEFDESDDDYNGDDDEDDEFGFESESCAMENKSKEMDTDVYQSREHFNQIEKSSKVVSGEVGPDEIEYGHCSTSSSCLGKSSNGRRASSTFDGNFSEDNGFVDANVNSAKFAVDRENDLFGENFEYKENKALTSVYDNVHSSSGNLCDDILESHPDHRTFSHQQYADIGPGDNYDIETQTEMTNDPYHSATRSQDLLNELKDGDDDDVIEESLKDHGKDDFGDGYQHDQDYEKDDAESEAVAEMDEGDYKHNLVDIDGYPTEIPDENLPRELNNEQMLYNKDLDDVAGDSIEIKQEMMDEYADDNEETEIDNEDELEHSSDNVKKRKANDEQNSEDNVDDELDNDDDQTSNDKKKTKMSGEKSSDSENEKDKNAAELKLGSLRRNIREVMDETKLEEATLAAQRQEMERLRRVQEQQRIIRDVQRQIVANRNNNKVQQRVMSLLQGGSTSLVKKGVDVESATVVEEKKPNTVVVKLSTGSGPPQIVNKKVLDMLKNQKNKVEDEDDNSNENRFANLSKNLNKPQMMTPSVSIAPIKPGQKKEGESAEGSPQSTDSNKTVKPKGKDVVTISSDEDDCIVISEGEEESEPEEDTSNSGMHTNDLFNTPDDQGRVLINVGHPESEENVFLSPQIARVIKPHQIGGVRFLYDNVVESLERYKTSDGFGCILAHSMGLGKTLQVISFCDVFLRYTDGRTILCIMPINTLQNWVAEFNMWLPTDPEVNSFKDQGEIVPRHFPLFVLNDNQKSLSARANVIQNWYKEGGVLLIGYELYRQLSLKKPPKTRKGSKRKLEQEEDMEDEKSKTLLEEIHEALVKPGPDLVICDEGHRIKNSHASISQALKQIRSKRRIVLTGYPLQNNLLEYWCMVDFVRPNYLGTKTEFSNMFERPIQNGQCIDSTPQDIRLMRYRAHVLHSLLEGFVQRRSHAVLQQTLPRKYEFVLLLRLTPFQRKLYNTFMNEVVRTKTVPNPLKAFAVCCKIWNHPDILYNFLKKRADEEEYDLDIEETSTSIGTPASGPSTPMMPSTPPQHPPLKRSRNNRSTRGFQKDTKSARKNSKVGVQPINKAAAVATVMPNTANTIAKPDLSPESSTNSSIGGNAGQAIQFSSFNSSQFSVGNNGGSTVVHGASDNFNSNYNQTSTDAGQTYSSSSSDYSNGQTATLSSSSSFNADSYYQQQTPTSLPSQAQNYSDNYYSNSTAGTGYTSSNSYWQQQQNQSNYYNNSSAATNINTSSTNTDTNASSSYYHQSSSSSADQFVQQPNSQYSTNSNESLTNNYSNNTNTYNTFNQSHSLQLNNKSNSNNSSSNVGVSYSDGNFLIKKESDGEAANRNNFMNYSLSSTTNSSENNMAESSTRSTNYNNSILMNESVENVRSVSNEMMNLRDDINNRTVSRGLSTTVTANVNRGNMIAFNNMSSISSQGVTRPAQQNNFANGSNSVQSNFMDNGSRFPMTGSNQMYSQFGQRISSDNPPYQNLNSTTANNNNSNNNNNNNNNSNNSNNSNNNMIIRQNYGSVAGHPSQSQLQGNNGGPGSSNFRPGLPGGAKNHKSLSNLQKKSSTNTVSDFPKNNYTPGLPGGAQNYQNSTNSPSQTNTVGANNNTINSQLINHSVTLPSHQVNNGNATGNNTTTTTNNNNNSNNNAMPSYGQNRNILNSAQLNSGFLNSLQNDMWDQVADSASGGHQNFLNRIPEQNYGMYQNSLMEQQQQAPASNHPQSSFLSSQAGTSDLLNTSNAFSELSNNANYSSTHQQSEHNVFNLDPFTQNYSPELSSQTSNQTTSFMGLLVGSESIGMDDTANLNYPSALNLDSSYINSNFIQNAGSSSGNSNTMSPAVQDSLMQLSQSLPPTMEKSATVVPMYSNSSNNSSTQANNNVISPENGSMLISSSSSPVGAQQNVKVECGTQSSSTTIETTVSNPNLSPSPAVSSQQRLPSIDYFHPNQQSYAPSSQISPGGSNPNSQNYHPNYTSQYGNSLPLNQSSNSSALPVSHRQTNINWNNGTGNFGHQSSAFHQFDTKESSPSLPNKQNLSLLNQQQSASIKSEPIDDKDNNATMHLSAGVGGNSSLNFYKSSGGQVSPNGGSLLTAGNHDSSRSPEFKEPFGNVEKSTSYRSSSTQNSSLIYQQQQQQQQPPNSQQNDFRSRTSSVATATAVASHSSSGSNMYSRCTSTDMGGENIHDNNSSIANLSPSDSSSGVTSESEIAIAKSRQQFCSSNAKQQQQFFDTSDSAVTINKPHSSMLVTKVPSTGPICVDIDDKKPLQDDKKSPLHYQSKKIESVTNNDSFNSAALTSDSLKLVKKADFSAQITTPGGSDGDVKIDNSTIDFKSPVFDDELEEGEIRMPAPDITNINQKVKEEPGIPYDWAVELFKEYEPGHLEASAKMLVFFCMLEEIVLLGDRLLLFSQSLFTLDLIEEFLHLHNIPNTEDRWTRNRNYFRLDGSTSALEREKLINEFNSNTGIYLFLVSTRAGSLGINLVGANRVIVFDASWNPCHDTQAVCRVYRYGQQKSCYVYRFVMDNCLERKIYDRQINKQGMSDRVVDEGNPAAYLSIKDISSLCWDNAEDVEVNDLSAVKDKYNDLVIQKVIEQYGHHLSKEPFQHESLLIERKDKKLSSAEKKMAKRSYELEKQANTRNVYGYYGTNNQHGLQIRAGKPMASVRPMQIENQYPKDGVRKWIPAEVWQKQGMSAQEMTLPLDVVIPTNTGDSRSSIVLRAGQKVMVLKSPKGIYMQLENGKIIAIKTTVKTGGGAGVGPITNKNIGKPNVPGNLTTMRTFNRPQDRNVTVLGNRRDITLAPVRNRFNNARGINTGTIGSGGSGISITGVRPGMSRTMGLPRINQPSTPIRTLPFSRPAQNRFTRVVSTSTQSSSPSSSSLQNTKQMFGPNSPVTITLANKKKAAAELQSKGIVTSVTQDIKPSSASVSKLTSIVPNSFNNSSTSNPNLIARTANVPRGADMNENDKIGENRKNDRFSHHSSDNLITSGAASGNDSTVMNIRNDSSPRSISAPANRSLFATVNRPAADNTASRLSSILPDSLKYKKDINLTPIKTSSTPSPVTTPHCSPVKEVPKDATGIVSAVEGYNINSSSNISNSNSNHNNNLKISASQSYNIPDVLKSRKGINLTPLQQSPSAPGAPKSPHYTQSASSGNSFAGHMTKHPQQHQQTYGMEFASSSSMSLQQLHHQPLQQHHHQQQQQQQQQHYAHQSPQHQQQKPATVNYANQTDFTAAPSQQPQSANFSHHHQITSQQQQQQQQQVHQQKQQQNASFSEVGRLKKEPPAAARQRTNVRKSANSNPTKAEIVRPTPVVPAAKSINNQVKSSGAVSSSAAHSVSIFPVNKGAAGSATSSASRASAFSQSAEYSIPTAGGAFTNPSSESPNSYYNPAPYNSGSTSSSAASFNAGTGYHHSSSSGGSSAELYASPYSPYIGGSGNGGPVSGSVGNTNSSTVNFSNSPSSQSPSSTFSSAFLTSNQYNATAAANGSGGAGSYSQYKSASQQQFQSAGSAPSSSSSSSSSYSDMNIVQQSPYNMYPPSHAAPQQYAGTSFYHTGSYSMSAQSLPKSDTLLKSSVEPPPPPQPPPPSQ